MPSAHSTLRSNTAAAHALLWSVVLHLLAVALAAVPVVRRAVASWQSAAVERAAEMASAVPEVPREIEVVVPEIVAVPAASEEPERFIRTDGLAEAKPDPGKSRFISDRDTRAASSAPADPASAEGMISQEGIDIPVVEVIRADQSNGEEETQPPGPDQAPALTAASPAAPALREPLESTPAEESPPSPTPSPTPPAPATPARSAAPPPPARETVALMKESDVALAKVDADEPPPEAKYFVEKKSDPPRPTPAMREPEVAEAAPRPRATPPPPRPASAATTPPAGFSSQRQPTQMRGTISNQGPASVDAENTPTGRYMKQVTSAIEREWHRKRLLNRDFVTYGTIQLVFYVNAKGQVLDLSIKNRKGANPVMQDFTLNAVLDAKIPPMPPGLTDILDQERLQISYDIIVY